MVLTPIPYSSLEEVRDSRGMLAVTTVEPVTYGCVDRGMGLLGDTPPSHHRDVTHRYCHRPNIVRHGP